MYSLYNNTYEVRWCTTATIEYTDDGYVEMNPSSYNEEDYRYLLVDPTNKDNAEEFVMMSYEKLYDSQNLLEDEMTDNQEWNRTIVVETSYSDELIHCADNAHGED